ISDTQWPGPSLFNIPDKNNHTKIHIHIILEKTSFLVLWYISFSSCLYNDMYSFSNTFCNYRFILSLLSKHHQKLEVTTAIMNIKRQIRMAVNQ
ncbi:TPA: hypothetical protein N6890_RS21405, partial [Escherichia coli]